MLGQLLQDTLADLRNTSQTVESLHESIEKLKTLRSSLAGRIVEIDKLLGVTADVVPPKPEAAQPATAATTAEPAAAQARVYRFDGAKGYILTALSAGPLDDKTLYGECKAMGWKPKSGAPNTGRSFHQSCMLLERAGLLRKNHGRYELTRNGRVELNRLPKVGVNGVVTV